MKYYKLQGWPDLPVAFRRTAYRRMLHRMSQRYASVPQLMHDSGLARAAVIQFIDLLTQSELLSTREDDTPESRFGQLRPVQWFRRTFYAEDLA